MITALITKMHPIDIAANKLGGIGALAVSIGVAPSTPSMWKARGQIPPQYCLAIERATAGEVTRATLRPEDYWLIWPDLPAPSVDAGALDAA